MQGKILCRKGLRRFKAALGIWEMGGGWEIPLRLSPLAFDEGELMKEFKVTLSSLKKEKSEQEERGGIGREETSNTSSLPIPSFIFLKNQE